MTNPFSYHGLRVVVTGAARGVGATLLDVLAELDVAHVTAVDLNPPSGPHHAFLATDLSDEAAVRDVVTRIDGPVNVLFNNAGVADTQPDAAVLAVNYLALRTLSEGLLLDRMPEGGASSTPRRPPEACGASVRRRSTLCSTSTSPAAGPRPCNGSIRARPSWARRRTTSRKKWWWCTPCARRVRRCDTR